MARLIIKFFQIYICVCLFYCYQSLYYTLDSSFLYLSLPVYPRSGESRCITGQGQAEIRYKSARLSLVSLSRINSLNRDQLILSFYENSHGHLESFLTVRFWSLWEVAIFGGTEKRTDFTLITVWITPAPLRDLPQQVDFSLLLIKVPASSLQPYHDHLHDTTFLSLIFFASSSLIT